MALLPFAVLAPAVGVMLFGLALTAKDGLLALIGLVTSCVAVGFAVYLWPAVADAVNTVVRWS